MKKIALFAIVTLSTLLPLFSLAQTQGGTRIQSGSASAEQVLLTFVEAVGGISAYENIKTSFSKGRIIDWDQQQIHFEAYFKSPDKGLTVEQRSKTEIRRGHDGTISWVKEGDHKARRVKRPYDIANAITFGDILHWRNKFKESKFMGEADVLDRKAYVLAVVGERPATLYFDQQTGLLLRKDFRWEQNTIETYYANYVEIAGVKLPWQVGLINRNTGKKYITIITEVRTNLALDDVIFAMPTP